MAAKSGVLAALEKRRGEVVSGQELGDSLGVSRAAVWKAVSELRGDGYDISAEPGGGYRLAPESDVLSEAGVRAWLPKELGESVRVFRSVGSTNTEAKRLALDGAPHGAMAAASEQTAGRGRYGKTFYSPMNTGVYLSVVLRPRESRMSDVQMSTIAAAVAVCRAVEKLTGLSPQIKWVNDLYLGGKKVCGILTEAMTGVESGEIDSVIVGIGVNCTTADFPDELSGKAGSLGARGLSRNRLAAEILLELLAAVGQIGEPGLIGEYRRRSLMLGKNVTFDRGGTEVSAKVLDINDRGNLVVRTPSGEILALSSGEVSVRGAVQ